MMTFLESAAKTDHARAHEAVLAEMLAGGAAARRLGVGVVMRDVNGEWRAAARWQGSRAQTDAADRRLRLQLEARSLPAPADADVDRARRLRAAEAETSSINPLSRRETALHPFWLGLGERR